MIHCKQHNSSCYSDACTEKGGCVTPEDHLRFEGLAAANATAAENARARAEGENAVLATLRKLIPGVPETFDDPEALLLAVNEWAEGIEEWLRQEDEDKLT